MPVVQWQWGRSNSGGNAGHSRDFLRPTMGEGSGMCVCVCAGAGVALVWSLGTLDGWVGGVLSERGAIDAGGR